MAQPMVVRKLDKNVLRVTVVKREADGTRVAMPVYDEMAMTLMQPRKKQTGVAKVAEKRQRKGIRRAIRALDCYLALHERSNRKKKNGWARDYFKNSMKAVRKSADD